MLKSELLEKLQHSIQQHGDSSISERELMEIAFAGTRSMTEWLARDQIVRDIIRAKRDAHAPMDSVFFKDVWPAALDALIKSRAE